MRRTILDLLTKLYEFTVAYDHIDEQIEICKLRDASLFAFIPTLTTLLVSQFSLLKEAMYHILSLKPSVHLLLELTVVNEGPHYLQDQL